MNQPANEAAAPGQGRRGLGVGLGILAALLLGYWAGRTERAAPGASVDSGVAALEPPAEAPAAPTHAHADLRQDPSRGAAVANEVFSRIAEEVAAEAPKHPEAVRWLSEEELLERYGESSKVDLISANRAVLSSLSARSDELLFQQFERGQYRSVVVPYGTPIEHSLKADDGGLKSIATRSVPREDGTTELQLVEVRFNDHEDLLALDHEAAWLSGYLKDKYGYDPILGDVGRILPEPAPSRGTESEPR
ncbi:MAG: hypothetical protein H6828_15785 [Planctomycetes bacterium]|nr:hypothetical protein [Planctomycetota bacterium]